MIPCSDFVILFYQFGLNSLMGYIELECRLGTVVHDALTCRAVRGDCLHAFSSLGPPVRPIRTGDLREAFQESENRTSRASSGLALKVIQGHSVMYRTWAEHVPSPVQIQGVGKDTPAPCGRSGLQGSLDMAHQALCCQSATAAGVLWPQSICGWMCVEYWWESMSGLYANAQSIFSPSIFLSVPLCMLYFKTCTKCHVFYIWHLRGYNSEIPSYIITANLTRFFNWAVQINCWKD